MVEIPINFVGNRFITLQCLAGYKTTRFIVQAFVIITWGDAPVRLVRQLARGNPCKLCELTFNLWECAMVLMGGESVRP